MSYRQVGTETHGHKVSHAPSERERERERQAQEDAVIYDPEPLADDLYGVGITSFIRDVRKLVIREGKLCLRFSRMTVTLMILWVTIGMQVFLILEFKRLITSSSVHKIRHLYSQYEQWMYAGKTELTVNGFHRGIPGHFVAARFHSLPGHISKESICSFPFSRPYFSGIILMVWTFTVVTDLRRIHFLADLLLFRTETIGSARDMLEDQQDHTTLLVGLTAPVKALLTVLVFLPRLILDLVLLWLGCRWLLATTDFSDLLLNAIALEFILLLKDLIYNAVVPKRNQWETSTMLIPHKRSAVASWTNYMGAFVWFVAVTLWAFVYMVFLQQVLPDYRWDIHAVCEEFLAEATQLTAGSPGPGSVSMAKPRRHG